MTQEQGMLPQLIASRARPSGASGDNDGMRRPAAAPGRPIIVRRSLAMLAFGLCVAAPRPAAAQPPPTRPRRRSRRRSCRSRWTWTTSRFRCRASSASSRAHRPSRSESRAPCSGWTWSRAGEVVSRIQWLPEADRRLPTPYGTAWNREFLDMVTPQTARPFGQSTGWDLLQLMSTSLVEGLTTKSLAQKIKASAARRRAAEAHAEVDAAIDAWRSEQNAPRPSPAVPAGPAPESSAPDNAASPSPGTTTPASPPE